MASALCASYIGGSVNFAAVSQSLGLTPGPLLAASMAADNIAMAAYLTVIMIIPAKNVAAASQGRDFTTSSLPGSDTKTSQQQGIVDGFLFVLFAHRQTATARTLCWQSALLHANTVTYARSDSTLSNVQHVYYHAVLHDEFKVWQYVCYIPMQSVCRACLSWHHSNSHSSSNCYSHKRCCCCCSYSGEYIPGLGIRHSCLWARAVPSRGSWPPQHQPSSHGSCGITVCLCR